MPTISQLPPADAVTAADLIPISQGGSAHSVSVGALLAQTQPAIIVESQSLLGRVSIGSGGPDAITVGEGLGLTNGTLVAISFDPMALSAQPSISPDDQLVVTNSGISQRIGLGQVRDLFTAGSNIAIDTSGVISAFPSGTVTSYNLAALSPITTIAQGDLIGVNQGGQDHSITYANLLDGVTIDLVQPAGPTSDSDSFLVAQTGNILLRQTLGALWPWLSGKLSLWKRPVIELSVDTTLDGTVHNNAIVVCSGSLLISVLAANMGNGFTCDLINVSSGPVTLSPSIIASNGSSILSPNQSCGIHCITYSGGTTVFASVSAGGTATALPGQVFTLTETAVTSTSVTLSWSAPVSGGAATAYMVQYRVSGTVPWIAAGQTGGVTNFNVNGLQSTTSYDFSVYAMNNMGAGPVSSTATVTTTSGASPPGQPTAVAISNITSNGMVCSWAAPVIGGAGATYGLQFRVSGQAAWSTAASNLSTTTASITGLVPSTTYEIQVTASNGAGSGPPSALVVGTTLQAGGLVTSISWNVAPLGTFTHGVGAIGVNVHVTPASAAVQFGFSTSSATPPGSWVTAINVNTDLWGAYIPTPATAGSWYAWAEGTDGSAPIVYSTPITVT